MDQRSQTTEMLEFKGAADLHRMPRSKGAFEPLENILVLEVRVIIYETDISDRMPTETAEMSSHEVPVPSQRRWRRRRATSDTPQLLENI